MEFVSNIFIIFISLSNHIRSLSVIIQDAYGQRLINCYLRITGIIVWNWITFTISSNKPCM